MLDFSEKGRGETCYYRNQEITLERLAERVRLSEVEVLEIAEMETLLLDNQGKLIAETASANGGNITLLQPYNNIDIVQVSHA